MCALAKKVTEVITQLLYWPLTPGPLPLAPDPCL